MMYCIDNNMNYKYYDDNNIMMVLQRISEDHLMKSEDNIVVICIILTFSSFT